MGEMQIFTCQTGPLSLALRVVEGDRAALPRVPRGISSLGTGQVSVREADGREAQWGAPGGRGFCFEWKRAFGGVVLGRTGWSMKQGEQTTRKHWCWEEPAFWEVQEVYRNEGHGVICSLFSRFPTLTKLFWCQNCPRALSLWALTFMTSSDLPF